MFVSGVDVRDLAGLSEVRMTLEAGRRGSRPSGRRRRTALAIELLLDELEQVRDAPSERALIDLDQRIHRHIYECAHNEFLEATLNEYYVLTLRIWFLALDRVARLEDAIQEHRELLVAIRDGDGTARKRRCAGTCRLRERDPRVL